ncbi:CCA tRNA nucleotidyltransferase [Stieleria varia]|uniref:tRNA nucleotidyltransferase/poly(A) polymerase n=1 Tax=Stieleria varia TaxID=2528005 RepID=A0A5C6B724_9BACT|nr:CCA tRNA nucleotidyltransferase [Stieleria varia]TWU07710.1 tRNA nucleotidyltransferase/poly(A) polymerase [Stieleria varia]
MFHENLFQSAPECSRGYQEAVRITRVLADAGFVAYFAGGCVRDALLGRAPKDFDVATNATPETIREVFGHRHTLAFGASFGVIGVLPPRHSYAGDSHSDAPSSVVPPVVMPTEVATFRSDGEYSDGRRPDSVHFGSAEQDALRRDFTINGLFYDPQADEVIDFVGGQVDLEQGLLRTIGQPDQRIDEDKLRMLRAVRFATVLGFEMEESTARSIRDHAHEITVVSGERIGAEMRKIISAPAAAVGLRLMQQLDLMRRVFPAAADHDLSELDPYLDALIDRPFADCLACVQVALGLESDERVRRDLVQRWKLTNEELRVLSAVGRNWRRVVQLDELPWSQAQPILLDRDIRSTVNVARAVASATDLKWAGVQRAAQVLQWPEERLNPAMLLTGDDLVDLGFRPGKQFALILSSVRAAQLDEQITSRQEAIEMAQQIASQ